PFADGHPHTTRPDPFWAFVVHNGVNVGMWKRTVATNQVRVETRLAASMDAYGRESVHAAAQRLGEFLGRELDYHEGEGTPPLWGGERGHPATRRPRR